MGNGYERSSVSTKTYSEAIRGHALSSAKRLRIFTNFGARLKVCAPKTRHYATPNRMYNSGKTI